MSEKQQYHIEILLPIIIVKERSIIYIRKQNGINWFIDIIVTYWAIKSGDTSYTLSNPTLEVEMSGMNGGNTVYMKVIHVMHTSSGEVCCMILASMNS